MINGVFILLGAGAWVAYKLACWVDARATDREIRSEDES